MSPPPTPCALADWGLPAAENAGVAVWPTSFCGSTVAGCTCCLDMGTLTTRAVRGGIVAAKGMAGLKCANAAPLALEANQSSW